MSGQPPAVSPACLSRFHGANRPLHSLNDALSSIADEVPVPYKRVLSAELLAWCAGESSPKPPTRLPRQLCDCRFYDRPPAVRARILTADGAPGTGHITTTAAAAAATASGRFLFHKDTCCIPADIEAKIKAVQALGPKAAQFRFYNASAQLQPYHSRGTGAEARQMRIASHAWH